MFKLAAESASVGLSYIYISIFNNPALLISTVILLFEGVTLSTHEVISGPEVTSSFQTLLINPAFPNIAGNSISNSLSGSTTAVFVIATFWLVKIALPFLAFIVEINPSISLTSSNLLVERSKCSNGNPARQAKLLFFVKLLPDNSNLVKATKFSKPVRSSRLLLFKFISVIVAITSGAIVIDFSVSLYVNCTFFSINSFLTALYNLVFNTIESPETSAYAGINGIMQFNSIIVTNAIEINIFLFIIIPPCFICPLAFH